MDVAHLLLMVSVSDQGDVEKILYCKDAKCEVNIVKRADWTSLMMSYLSRIREEQIDTFGHLVSVAQTQKTLV